MKPIMHLYSDKVTITDKRELMPLVKSSTVHVAASRKSGIMYTNVSKEYLDDFISRNIETHPSVTLLKLAVSIATEIKTVPDLRIADDDTVFVEETLKADVLMTNKVRVVVIVGVEGKLYTNNVAAAKECIEEDVINGELSAALLKTLIDLEGLTECELQGE
jgi:hypothetical protein